MEGTPVVDYTVGPAAKTVGFTVFVFFWVSNFVFQKVSYRLVQQTHRSRSNQVATPTKNMTTTAGASCRSPNTSTVPSLLAWLVPLRFRFRWLPSCGICFWRWALLLLLLGLRLGGWESILSLLSLSLLLILMAMIVSERRRRQRTETTSLRWNLLLTPTHTTLPTLLSPSMQWHSTVYNDDTQWYSLRGRLKKKHLFPFSLVRVSIALTGKWKEEDEKTNNRVPVCGGWERCGWIFTLLSVESMPGWLSLILSHLVSQCLCMLTCSLGYFASLHSSKISPTTSSCSKSAGKFEFSTEATRESERQVHVRKRLGNVRLRLEVGWKS